jgi:CRISPR-associated protein Csd1
MALDPDHSSTAYQLGRLFYVLESAQRAALGTVNASIADRYYAAASATPARVFGPLLRNLRNHVSDARKRGQGGWIEPKVTEIMARLPAELPRTLKLEDQGRFAVGYYHERATRPARNSDDPASSVSDNQSKDSSQ